MGFTKWEKPGKGRQLRGPILFKKINLPLAGKEKRRTKKKGLHEQIAAGRHRLLRDSTGTSPERTKEP